MSVKRIPAPQRAGTSSRFERECAVVENLAWLRSEDSAEFDACMKLLADLSMRNLK